MRYWILILSGVGLMISYAGDVQTTKDVKVRVGPFGLHRRQQSD